MHKIDKPTAKKIKYLAASIQPFNDTSVHGANNPVPVNHERRIRHAYQANGEPGIMAYLNKLAKLINKQSND